jgi:hypothetical protein
MSETQTTDEFGNPLPSTNDASDNPVPSTNDASGNPVPTTDNTTTMVNGINMPNCNSSTNGKEYYLSPEKSGKLLGGILSIPFLLSSIGSTSFMAMIFGLVALGIRYGGKEKKSTNAVIVLVIFFVLCLLSMIGSIISMRMNIKKIQVEGERPCYSEKEKKVIEK